MRKYKVCYKTHPSSETFSVEVEASNKFVAYDKAVYDVIAKHTLRGLPYSAWLESVTYSNGKVKTFDNFEGKPY